MKKVMKKISILILFVFLFLTFMKSAYAIDLLTYTQTYDLDEEDKDDDYQKNYQYNNGLVKSVEWTNKSQGKAEINLSYNIPADEPLVSRAAYFFGGCLYHEFSKNIAIKEINELLAVYDVVDVFGTTEGGKVNDTAWSTSFKSGDTVTLPDTVFKSASFHYSGGYIIQYLDHYLESYDPDLIVIALDGRLAGSFGTTLTTKYGSLGEELGTYFTFNGNKMNGYSEKGLSLIHKLATYQQEGRYFISASPSNKNTNWKFASTNTVADINENFISSVLFTPYGLDTGSLTIDIVTKSTKNFSDYLPEGQIIYSYGDSLNPQGVVYNIPTHEIRLTDMVSSDFTIDRENVTTSAGGIVSFAGQTIIVRYPAAGGGQEINVKIPITLTDSMFFGEDDSFKDTNTYYATAKIDSKIVYISSPKLYKREKGQIIVHHYIKGTTEKISDDVTIHAKYGEEITTEKATDIPTKYEFDTVTPSAKITLNSPSVDVIYYYKLKQGKVIVRYVDKDTNKDLVDAVTHTGNVGDKYESQEKKIDGYTLAEKPESTSVTLTPEDILVVYKYKKVEEKVKVENTLANASFLSMIIGVLAISIGLFTIYRQVYSKENS
ncbi:MAG: MucBP domain-containing protein [Bacilli bacterium]|nr:MucBP domain-containing protein [Bacilli bacterium]